MFSFLADRIVIIPVFEYKILYWNLQYQSFSARRGNFDKKKPADLFTRTSQPAFAKGGRNLIFI